MNGIMQGVAESKRSKLLPWLVAGGMVLIWFVVSAFEVFPRHALPSPYVVASALVGEIRSGRLYNDIIASLFRVGVGFLLSCGLGISAGLYLGHHSSARAALIPLVNFLRCISPLAWIPFAILWFGIGDKPSIFLIFMAGLFPLLLSTTVAVASIPNVYFRVARDYGICGWELLARVTFPAALPQIIVALRVTAGLAWLVVVAAEMVAGRDGLGFAIIDARNGLRIDLVIVAMLTIGTIGILLDRLLNSLTRLPSVRWGYAR